jgi:adenylate cyclase
VISDGGDVYGEVVNVASRIEPLAPPGGVAVSQQVFAQVRNKPELPLQSGGAAKLKNIGEPILFYRVAFPWGTEPQEEKKRRERRRRG